jgi:hypothetical protein
LDQLVQSFSALGGRFWVISGRTCGWSGRFHTIRAHWLNLTSSSSLPPSLLCKSDKVSPLWVSPSPPRIPLADVCVQCQGSSPALDRMQRTAARSPTESPTLAEATKVVAARRRSRMQPRQQPSRFQSNRAKSARSEAATAAASKKRKAKIGRLEAANAAHAAKKQKKSRERVSNHRSKRSQSPMDGSNGCKRRR